MKNLESIEKAELLKKSLTIVDKLGKLDIDDLDNDKIDELIKEAKKLRKNRFWILQ